MPSFRCLSEITFIWLWRSYSGDISYFPSFFFQKERKKEKTAALSSLRVTRTPDFYAMLQVPFNNTMAGSLTMSCVYSKQPARQSEAWAFAQCLFSAVIRHVRFSHSIWEIILISNFILSEICVTILIQFYGEIYFFIPVEKHTPHTFVLQKEQLFSTFF